MLDRARLCWTLVILLALVAPAFAGDAVPLEAGQAAPFSGVLVDLDHAQALRRDRVRLEEALATIQVLEDQLRAGEAVERGRAAQVQGLEETNGLLERQAALPTQQVALLREALALAQDILRPFGLSLTFMDHRIELAKADVKAIPELAEHLPVREKLKALLAKGPLPLSEIAEALEISQETARRTLNRNLQFINLEPKGREGRWALRDLSDG